MTDETSKENIDNADAGVKDAHGDLDANSPNPANPNPESNTDCPQLKPTISKIEELSAPVQVSEQSPNVTRPPKPSGPSLGPYYQFITTDINKMLWFGSVLIFRDVSYDQPNMEFFCEPKIDYN